MNTEQISRRTKATFSTAKGRGVALGKFGREVLSALSKTKADDLPSVRVTGIKKAAG